MKRPRPDRSRRLGRFLLVVILSICLAPATGDGVDPPRAVFLSLDGFGADLVDQGWVDRYMPRLSELLASRAVAVRSRSSFPSITPTGHSALWTGAYGGVSGIAGASLGRLPADRHTILETISGFSSIPQRAEPIYIAAPRQGLRTVVVGATQLYPFRRYLESTDLELTDDERALLRDHLTAVDLYAGRLARESVVTWDDLEPLDRLDEESGGDIGPATTDPFGGPLGFRLPLVLGLEREPAGSHLRGRTARVALVGAWRASRPGGPRDRLELALEMATDRQGGGRESRPGGEPPGPIVADRLTIPTPADRAYTLEFDFFGASAFAVVELLAADEEAGEFALFVATPAILQAFPADAGDSVLEQLGGLYGNGASYAYRDGRLGTILPDGGDGRAEERYATTAVELIERFGRLWSLATRDRGWDLAVAYNPYPDEALHTWYGWLDPGAEGYDPALAERLEPYLGRVLAALDGYVGRILDSLDQDDHLILSSDHGMTSTDRLFFPNRWLRENGFLAVDEKGRIDLSRTRAWYGGGFQIRINHAARRDGIVRPEEVPDLVARLAEGLATVGDPETGSRVVPRIIVPGDPDADLWGIGPGDPRTGDLLIDLAPSTYYSIDHGEGPILAPAPPMGSHGFHPDRSEMHSLTVLRGPGVEHLRGADEPVRHIDAAPTLARWLGIDPPRHATGSSLARPEPDS